MISTETNDRPPPTRDPTVNLTGTRGGSFQDHRIDCVIKRQLIPRRFDVKNHVKRELIANQFVLFLFAYKINTIVLGGSIMCFSQIYRQISRGEINFGVTYGMQTETLSTSENNSNAR